MITHLLLSKPQPYAVFLTERFFRLFPVFILAFVAAIALHSWHVQALETVAAAWPSKKAISLLALYANQMNDLAGHILAHVTMLHGALDRFIPHSSIAFLGTAWSISLEWQFYLVAPFIIAAIIRLPAASFALLLVAALAGVTYGFGFATLLRNFAWFGIGIATALIVNQRSVVTAAISLPLFATIALFHQSSLTWLPIGIWGVMAVSLWLPDSALSRGLQHRHLIRTGEISYSTYVWHFVILIAVEFAVLEVYRPTSQVMLLALVASVSLPLTAAASALSYEYIERPWAAFGKSTAGLQAQPC